MRTLTLIITSLCIAFPVYALDTLIIQSHSTPQFDQTVRQIQNSCGSRSRTYVMGDYTEFDFGRIVREEQPRVVLALGDKPLQQAQKLRTTTLYAMALSANEKRLGENITGVTMFASPELYLKLFRKLSLKRVGVVYSTAKSGAYLDRALKAASEYNVQLVTTMVTSPDQTESALDRLMKQRIDALWMIPDTTAVTPGNLKAYFNLAKDEQIPLITFSRSYLDQGALAALEASRSRMTSQICSSLKQLQNEVSPSDLPITDITDATLFTNETVANRLGIPLSGVHQLFKANR